MTSSGQPQAPLDGLCTVCCEALVDGACPNTVCRLPDRAFSRLYTVSESADETWDLIYRFKYGEEKELAEQLGRMLVDYLQDRRAELERFDHLTTTALYIGPQARRLWDYLQLIQDAAQRIDPSWPFATDLIAKVRPTGRFLGIGVDDRRVIAEGELRDALQVPDPSRVEGRRVLVIDDAYSEGFTLREMARALRQAGAVEVAGLVFARRKGT
ncbi:ComF family protein [Aeromicrobium wangtongii]|uniref:Phosphoribosyltransferase family protein n=1 Tax=Aeromicrobium wangtongii TaxID=2969247 RepID=A0ABY5MHN3_9ACTN|nr:phosphoribosyltransferase family protein [Aeromicrobium wangtongii]UUP15401.1 phosphoribosyltransferase family protein [Aeromicrobium wangtongii]